MGLFPISTDDKLACIEREIKLRERVYPRFVADGRMTAEKAEHELAVMKEIWSDYKSGLVYAHKSAPLTPFGQDMVEFLKGERRGD